MSETRYQELIATYIHAKDHNRPHLMRQAFHRDATLHMQVNSQAIAFPPVSRGLDAITEVLVRKFSSSYENVYTFCLEPVSRAERAPVVECDWLVVMADKASGEARVGCGRYRWQFAPQADGLATVLDITIEHMKVLAPERLDALLEWIAPLPYPWCTAPALLERMPAMAELSAVASYFRRS
jgi:hypothetical protein